VLKKMVEKTRAENERLKKTPAFTSSEQLTALQAENDELKVCLAVWYLLRVFGCLWTVCWLINCSAFQLTVIMVGLILCCVCVCLYSVMLIYCSLCLKWFELFFGMRVITEAAVDWHTEIRPLWEVEFTVLRV